MHPQRKEAMRQRLLSRDGKDCWYCRWTMTLGNPLDRRAMTLEHLVPKSVRGGNRIGNMVLACLECNNEADNLAIVDKIAMRDRKRAAMKDLADSYKELHDAESQSH